MWHFPDITIRNIASQYQIVHQSWFIDHKLNDNPILRILVAKMIRCLDLLFAMVLCICGQVMCLCCLPICAFMPFCEMQRNQFLSETSYFLSFFKCFILKSTLFMYSSVFIWSTISYTGWIRIDMMDILPFMIMYPDISIYLLPVWVQNKNKNIKVNHLTST